MQTLTNAYEMKIIQNYILKNNCETNEKLRLRSQYMSRVLGKSRVNNYTLVKIYFVGKTTISW